MLYDENNPILQIVGVEHMRWNGGFFDIRPREYSALAFRISGNATIRANGKEYSVRANDILYLPQNICYTAEYTDTEMLVIHFVTAKNDRELEVYSFKNVEQIYKQFLNARWLWENKKTGFRLYALSQLYLILGFIHEQRCQTSLPQHFLRALSFLNANFTNRALTVDMICRQAGMSATVFRQLFQRYYQKTPVQYITELRLERARNFISNGMSVEQAALESGFNDSKYFARVVKKHFHCTPRDLKQYGR